jgi:hypothetical protein
LLVGEFLPFSSTIAWSGLNESATGSTAIAFTERAVFAVFEICKRLYDLAEPAFSGFFGGVFVQRSGMLIKAFPSDFSTCGEVAEWLKAPASKADVP